MTVILEMGEWWIESFFVNHGNVGAGALDVKTVNLKHGGRFVGASTAIIQATVNLNDVQVLYDLNPTVPFYGRETDSIRVIVRNNNAAPQQIQTSIIVYMRK